MSDKWIVSDQGFVTPCHIWAGATSGPYGWSSEHRTLAHRAAWMETYGPILGRKHLHHLCPCRRCVNVEHMKLLTPVQHRRLHGDVARHATKLTADAVLDIRKSTDTLAVVGERHGISKAYAGLVRRGLAPEAFQLATPVAPWARGRPAPPRQDGALSDTDVELIRSREVSLNDLRDIFGVSRSYLNRIRAGKAPKP